MRPPLGSRWRAAVALASALAGALLAGGCASVPAASWQSIEVGLDPAFGLAGARLECQASNALGSWAFQAPGRVRVPTSGSPLQIRCLVPPGAAAVKAELGSQPSPEAARAASTGGKVGGALGLAAATATAPVAGPALGAVLVVGAVLRGRDIGAMVHFLATGGGTAYPARVVLAPTPDAPTGPSRP